MPSLHERLKARGHSLSGPPKVLRSGTVTILSTDGLLRGESETELNALFSRLTLPEARRHLLGKGPRRPRPLLIDFSTGFFSSDGGVLGVTYISQINGSAPSTGRPRVPWTGNEGSNPFDGGFDSDHLGDFGDFADLGGFGRATHPGSSGPGIHSGNPKDRTQYGVDDDESTNEGGTDAGTGEAGGPTDAGAGGSAPGGTATDTGGTTYNDANLPTDVAIAGATLGMIGGVLALAVADTPVAVAIAVCTFGASELGWTALIITRKMPNPEGGGDEVPSELKQYLEEWRFKGDVILDNRNKIAVDGEWVAGESLGWVRYGSPKAAGAFMPSDEGTGEGPTVPAGALIEGGLSQVGLAVSYGGNDEQDGWMIGEGWAWKRFGAPRALIATPTP